MKCSRCGGRVTGATWYCKHCGSAVGSSGNYFGDPSRQSRRWLWVAAIATVAVVGAAAGRLLKPTASGQLAELDRAGLQAPRQSAGEPADTPWPTPSAVPLAEESLPENAVSGAAQSGVTGSGVSSSSTGSGSTGWASSGSGGPVEGNPAAADTAPPGGAAPAPAPPAAVAPYGGSLTRADAPIWTAGRPPGRIILDGQLDDWVSQSIAVAQVAFGEDYWDGPADLSAAAFIAFDAANLYVAVRVTDDIFSQPSRGADLHLGDSVEAQLDTDLAGDFADAKYSADDWQIGLSPGDFAGKPPEAFVWRPEGTATGIRVASRKLETGYIVEASIPWPLLRVDPARTSRVGIAVNVSDNDYPGPAQVTMVSSAPRRSWDDPRSFGTLILRGTAPEADARP